MLSTESSAQAQGYIITPEQAQKALHCGMEQELKDQKIVLLEKQLEVAKREKALADQELSYQKKLTELVEHERDAYKNAFEREKDITDRALKLAEISKPKSDWQLQGLALLGAILLGVVVGK